MATDNKHVTWIDCLKGIGILSVVFAHVTDIKQEFVTKTLAKIKTWQTIGIIAALCVLLLVPNIYLDIKYNDYGIPVLSIALSLLAVLSLLFCLSRYLLLGHWSVSYRFADGAHSLSCSSTSLFTSASLAIAMCGWALWALRLVCWTLLHCLAVCAHTPFSLRGD